MIYNLPFCCLKNIIKTKMLFTNKNTNTGSLSAILLSVISFYQLFKIPVHFSKSRKFLTDLLLKNPESFPVKSFKYLKYFSNHRRRRAAISDITFYSLGCQSVSQSVDRLIQQNVHEVLEWPWLSQPSQEIRRCQ